MLTDAAIEGKVDRLNGLKENVIIGKPIPAATGLKQYRQITIEPTEPLPVTYAHPEAEAEPRGARGDRRGRRLRPRRARALARRGLALDGEGEPSRRPRRRSRCRRDGHR